LDKPEKITAPRHVAPAEQMIGKLGREACFLSLIATLPARPGAEKKNHHMSESAAAW